MNNKFPGHLVPALVAIVLIASCSSRTPSTQTKAANNQQVTTNEQQDEDFLTIISPRYGNWCGAGYPKDIHNANRPIDALDAACKTHDFCYEEKGYLNCDVTRVC